MKIKKREMMSSPEWRIMDASLNRASEGLRLLEDLVRFTFNDSSLSGRLKGLRHYLAGAAIPWQKELLTSRDSPGDIGRDADFDPDPSREDLISIIRSNAKRVQESLRTMEELAKLPELNKAFDWAKLKEMRYSLYELEKDILTRFQENNSG
ncbi:MAG: thiamine-phosphate pyrophosphorylase [Dehalococcoidia bacterium]|nr:thiamine-phosphate pyrophosphorylase [Dehalococcoidia bacterium]MDZ4247093.1 thiamine-phosphate pyrophosphorylase [Dehalococcoidia bacterium]